MISILASHDRLQVRSRRRGGRGDGTRRSRNRVSATHLLGDDSSSSQRAFHSSPKTPWSRCGPRLVNCRPLLDRVWKADDVSRWCVGRVDDRGCFLGTRTDKIGQGSRWPMSATLWLSNRLRRCRPSPWLSRETAFRWLRTPPD